MKTTINKLKFTDCKDAADVVETVMRELSDGGHEVAKTEDDARAIIADWGFPADDIHEGETYSRRVVIDDDVPVRISVTEFYGGDSGSVDYVYVIKCVELWP
ncbi:MAG: hypothetical protein IKO20_04190 [Bacteroidaceae bacterium]|nr:hypothetical protein [Bacteroidaceae bacterium]